MNEASRPATQSRPQADQTQRVGSPNLTNDHCPNSDVDPISSDTNSTFRAVYTGFDEDIEVEIVERVPASESEHKFGHAVIDRPEWDETKVALLQNIRVDVLEEDENDG